MAVKTSGPLFENGGIEGVLTKALKAVNEDDIKAIIVDGSIALGISPVEGAGRFQQYSDSYKKAIRAGRYKRYGKTISPVNLKLSGTLLKSFFSKAKGLTLKIGFDNFLASIHTVQGAGKSKAIRKMLPVKQGESFKRRISNDVILLVQKEINRILRK